LQLRILLEEETKHCLIEKRNLSTNNGLIMQVFEGVENKGRRFMITMKVYSRRNPCQPETRH